MSPGQIKYCKMIDNQPIVNTCINMEDSYKLLNYSDSFKCHLIAMNYNIYARIIDILQK